METSSPATDGEPAKPIRLQSRIIILFAVLLFISSCTQQEEKKEASPLIGKTVEKKNSTRLVIVAKKKSVGKKRIYLTFDDGPNRGTMNVLNAVKEDSVPATFFIVGKHVFNSPQQEETWKQLKADTSVELSNHSYTHALNKYSHFYQDPQGVVQDFEKSANTLGFTNNVVRMPGRNAWRIDTVKHTDIKESEAAIDSVHHAGFAVMGWDVEWMFDHKTLALTSDADLLLRQIENMLASQKTKTSGHLVLLAHDQAFQTQESIERLHYLIQQLKNNPEYELVLAANYPGVKNKTPHSIVAPLSVEKQ